MMHNFQYETIPGDLGKLVELRDNSEYPELKNLWWPRYDIECWNYMHKHRIQPEFFDEIMIHVDSPGIMVQAGGNCGQYVRQFSQRFGTVYTFEPDPLNFLCLTLNCGNNVIKTQACLGNDKNFVGIDRTYDAGAIHVDGPGNVPTVRIDDMDLPCCDLIQLDIEGYEYFALLGAQRTIEKYHPVIMIEWYDKWAERYGTNKIMLDNFFSKLGYCHIMRQDNDHIYKYMP